MAKLTVPGGKPFSLGEGERLRATADLKVYVPVEILEPPGTPLSELIRLSDQSADVGLLHAKDNPSKVVAIVVFLKAGDEISLGRSTEVVVTGAPADRPAFEPVT